MSICAGGESVHAAERSKRKHFEGDFLHLEFPLVESLRGWSRTELIGQFASAAQIWLLLMQSSAVSCDDSSHEKRPPGTILGAAGAAGFLGVSRGCHSHTSCPEEE